MADRFAVAVVGLVGGLMSVVVVLSFSSLIYSGELARFLALGSTMLLVGCMVMNLIGARASSLPGAILVHQDATTALAAAALSVVIVDVAADSQFSTALAILAAGSLATGVAMLVLGWRNAGDLVRFVPVPVMGGFLAGTGWLLLVGAFGLATGGELTAVTFANFVAALSIGLALTLALRSGRHAVVAVPAVVLGSVGAFHLLLAVTGTSVADARGLGLLPAQTGEVTLTGVVLGAVDWQAVAAALPRVAVIPVVASLALLMNVGGLEILAKRDGDLDRELRFTGVANLAAALTGSPGAYHTLGLSALGFRLDLHSRAVPVIAAAACGAAAVFGPNLVANLPLALVAGILAMVGLGFLTDWLVAARRRMSVAEYWLMVAIVVVIAWFGFMPGVLFGMAAAIVLFTIKYSRSDPVRHVFTARERASSIDRPPGERQALARWADRVLVAELQGFLFFGTAHKAVRALEERIRSDDLRFLVVDFRRVEGLDSTAGFSFARLQQTASEGGVSLVVSNASSLRGGWFGPSAGVEFAADIDEALELCEDRLLENETVVAGDHGHLLDDATWRGLLPHMERVDVETDDVLADMGEDADCVYFIQTGRIAVELPVGDRWQRVRSVGHGNLLGEFALYVDGGRSARLRAEMPSTVMRLTAEAVRTLEATDPMCALAFHRAVAQTMADRLISTNDFVRALIR